MATALKPALNLSIAGNGLLLNGNFQQWVPLLMDGSDDENGNVQVQMLVDTTSITSPADTGSRLLSFRSRKVKSVSPWTYEVKGMLTAENARHAVTAIVQAPDAHTPFFMITFTLHRAELKGVWELIDDQLKLATGNDTGTVRARAWLRSPEIAAA
ncbi:MAG: hypothetical protein SGI86_08500 [Deltaproteobacteria bacterium]|nr:hypothetical protein [Deltaproteobacteria bacterium]